MLRLPWKDESGVLTAEDRGLPAAYDVEDEPYWYSTVQVCAYTARIEMHYDVYAMHISVWDEYHMESDNFDTADEAKHAAEVWIYGELMNGLALFMPESETNDGSSLG